MVDILHRVGVEARSLDAVYDALTTIDGLAGWWTKDTSGGTDVGGVLTFRFEPGDIVMRVHELEPAKRVVWECLEGGPPEWVGTTVTFDLAQEGEFTIIRFKHEGWKEPVEFMAHCTTKWGTYLMSLKKLVETGTGEPAPDDVRISNWH